jgi:hypothetical protein
MLRLQFHYSVPKRVEEPKLNEDSYKPKQFRCKGPFVVSDGASESYDARTWSQLLVKRYRRRPQFSLDWVQRAVESYTACHNSENLSWSQQAAFARGSFATLLAVHIEPDNLYAEVLAVGDSIAVIGTEGELHASFPYSSPDQFDDHPLLISTCSDRNAWLSDADLSELTVSWPLSVPGVTLMAMTDALGKWLLTEPAVRFSQLASVRSRARFTNLVETERGAGRMRRDDTTLLVFDG